jgi:hypothetical protein
MTLASTEKPSPLIKPAAKQTPTTRSKTPRKRSLSRNRPWRFFEKLEWFGTHGVIEVETTEPAISQVQGNFSHSFRSERMP